MIELKWWQFWGILFFVSILSAGINDTFFDRPDHPCAVEKPRESGCNEIPGIGWVWIPEGYFLVTQASFINQEERIRQAHIDLQGCNMRLREYQHQDFLESCYLVLNQGALVNITHPSQLRTLDSSAGKFDELFTSNTSLDGKGKKSKTIPLSTIDISRAEIRNDGWYGEPWAYWLTCRSLPGTEEK